MKILKLIITGAIAGTALFLMPFFIFKIALFLLMASIFFKLFVGRRFGGRGMGGPNKFAFADKVRSMNEEDYNNFKADRNRGCSHHQKTTTNK